MEWLSFCVCIIVHNPFLLPQTIVFRFVIYQVIVFLCFARNSINHQYHVKYSSRLGWFCCYRHVKMKIYRACELAQTRIVQAEFSPSLHLGRPRPCLYWAGNMSTYAGGTMISIFYHIFNYQCGRRISQAHVLRFRDK